MLNHGKKTHETALTVKTGHNTSNNNSGNSGGRRFTKKFKGDCKQCGKKGHKSSDCWEKDANKSRRPNNWKSNTAHETAHVATTSRGTLHCAYCKKDNHTEDRCFKKKKDLEEKKSGREMALCIYEAALIAHAKSDGLLQPYTFIADSGASSHMVYDESM